MTPTRAQLDAAETWLLEDFRGLVEAERWTRHNKGVFHPDAFIARWWALQRRRLTAMVAIRAIRAMREAGAWKAPRCADCGGEVERTRHCYAVPTCEKCLPPPPPLEVEYPFQRRAEVAEARLAAAQDRAHRASLCVSHSIERMESGEPHAADEWLELAHATLSEVV